MKNATVWVIVIILIVLGAGWFFFMQSPVTPQAPAQDASQGANNPSSDSNGSGVTVSVGGDASQSVSAFTVRYTDSGFSPSSLTVPVGTTVTFINQSSRPMWVASGNHPTHTLYSGTTLQQHCPDSGGSAFDECATGNTYTFTFAKAGTWAYHNHVSAQDHGTIVVTK